MGWGSHAIKGKKHSVAVLDIGTNKVACFIAEPGSDEELHITGIGHQLSKGMRSGMITDISELEVSIVGAVHAAEQMAGETVENVIVNLSGTHLRSHAVSVELNVAGEGVSEHDIADLLREGCASISDKERSVVHCFAAQYHLDKSRGIRDPRNMFGEKLGADLHVVTADNVKLKNLASCIARCHLNIAEFIVSSHASGLGCLEPDEMDLGVLTIDIGGGETSMAAFVGGANVYCDVIPLGSSHVTSDIARGLSTSLADAERLKTLHGSAIVAPQDNQVMINIPQMGDEDSDEENSVPRAMLIGIIRPRLEEIFEIMRDKLERSGVESYGIRNVVLTGGASQLVGLRDLTAQILGKQVRLGKPHLVPGLADSVSGPAFSTAVGMLRYASRRTMEDRLFDRRKRTSGIASRGEKLLTWLREYF